MADMTVTGRDTSSRVLVIIESLTLFVFGIALMTYFYHSSVRNAADEIGVPGHDSFYHIKMAAMLPQVGILHDLPWLQYAYFRQQGHEFVSHHLGFHVLLMPFVYLSHWLTGDFLAGGRWATAAFFGLNLLLFNLLLRTAKVPYRWAWLVLFLLMPDQFFMRQSLVRAIGASLVFMQLLLLLLFQGRHVWAAVVAALYVQLYLGAVIFAPLLVGLYALALVFGPKDDRHFPWRMVAWTAGGWAIGVLTYPYFRGMLEFLIVQVTKTGLQLSQENVQVGQEWNPYSNTWWFLTMAAVPLAAWAGAACVRARFGPRLNAKELALLLINFAFLVLMLKARRFVEYWPPFCLLSAAYLSAPVLSAWPPLIPESLPGKTARANWATWPILGLAAACIGYLLWKGADRPDAPALLADWPTWAATLALLMLAPLTQVWLSQRAGGRVEVPIWRLAALLATAVAVFGCLALFVQFKIGLHNLPAQRLGAHPLWWAVAALYVLAPVAYYPTRRPSPAFQPAPAFVQTAAIALVALGLFGTTLSTGARQLASVGEQMRCGFDLPAMREAMEFLQQNSDPGDVVFTDDWDIFPAYFYYNSHNYYIVGLDPKFTQTRRPDLWERYIHISRGETPTTVTLAADGNRPRETLKIDLKDIRTEFKARYVVCDRDHQSFAGKLARDRNLAELVYPSKTYATCRNAPFLVFRIRAVDEPPVATAPAPPVGPEGHLYLGSLTPTSADQGWGELMTDSSVENRRLRLHGKTYRRGIGTHAPSKLLYNIPPGYDLFEAVVGVDDETNGQGSVVAAVYLDGTRAFESPLLTGGSEPVIVRIPLNGARQLLLTAETTADGQRFDHTDWADAKFTHSPGAAASQSTQPTENASENPAEESPESGAP
jgi:hypothetical protein